MVWTSLLPPSLPPSLPPFTLLFSPSPLPFPPLPPSFPPFLPSSLPFYLSFCLSFPLSLFLSPLPSLLLSLSQHCGVKYLLNPQLAAFVGERTTLQLFLQSNEMAFNRIFMKDWTPGKSESWWVHYAVNISKKAEFSVVVYFPALQLLKIRSLEEFLRSLEKS